MKKYIAIAVLMLGATLASAATGEVSKRISGCDYYVVDAPNGYALLEWYGGYDPDEGDSIIGAFNTYSFHNFFVGYGRTETRAYVEDWGLSEDDALEQLSDKCN